MSTWIAARGRDLWTGGGGAWIGTVGVVWARLDGSGLCDGESWYLVVGIGVIYGKWPGMALSGAGTLGIVMNVFIGYL